MNPLGGGGVGRIDQAEIGAACVVEPVGHVLNPVSLLDFEVLPMIWASGVVVAVRKGGAFGVGDQPERLTAGES